MTQVFVTPPPSWTPVTDYVPPIISVHSYSHAIKLGLTERVKAIQPFSSAAKFARSTARPTQAEHIPFVGVYFIEDDMSPLGGLNQAEPKFTSHVKLGISYIIQNNDTDEAEDILDAAFWSFMKLFHATDWSRFPFPHPDEPDRIIKVDGVVSVNHSKLYGTLGHNNETPVAESRIEIIYEHGFDFEPVPLDKLELVHMETWPWPAKPGEAKPITTEWTLPQP